MTLGSWSSSILDYKSKANSLYIQNQIVLAIFGENKDQIKPPTIGSGGEGSMALHGQQFWVTHSLCPSKNLNLFMDLMAPTCWKNSVFETWGLKFKQQYVTYLSYTSWGGHHTTHTTMTSMNLWLYVNCTLLNSKLHMNWCRRLSLHLRVASTEIFFLKPAKMWQSGHAKQDAWKSFQNLAMCFVHVFFA